MIKGNKLKYLKNIGIESDIFPGLIKAELYKTPQDFVVEEIFPKFQCSVERKIDKVPSSSKKYIYATLVKKKLSTFDACDIFAKKNKIPLSDISYCGLKDTNGITAQRICIRNKYQIKYINFKNFFLKDFIGSDKKLNLRNHQGNHFQIKAKINPKYFKQYKIHLKKVKEKTIQGLPNFYSLQRFGLRQNNHTLGKLILKNDYKRFVNKFLTDISDIESKETTLIRRKLKKNLNNLSACKKILNSFNGLEEEKRFIEDLEKLGELGAIRKFKLSNFFIHSYSSYLFNLALSRYLKDKKAQNIKLEKIGSNTNLDKINYRFYSPVFKKRKNKNFRFSHSLSRI